MAFSFRFFFDASIRNFNLSLRFYGTARHLVYLAVESSRERFFSFTVRPVHVFLLHPVFYDCEMRQLHTRPSRIKLRESIPTRALALWQPPAVRFSFFFLYVFSTYSPLHFSCRGGNGCSQYGRRVSFHFCAVARTALLRQRGFSHSPEAAVPCRLARGRGQRAISVALFFLSRSLAALTLRSVGGSIGVSSCPVLAPS